MAPNGRLRCPAERPAGARGLTWRRSSKSSICGSRCRPGAAPWSRSTMSALSIAPGEVLGVVGELGAGKSLTGAAIIGLLEPPLRIAGGADPLRRPAHRQPAVRGDAPHPRQGDRRDLPGPADQPQPALHRRPPACRDHPHPSRSRPGGGAQRALALLREVGIAGAGAAHRPLPAPVLGRHAPARRDRAGARRQSAADHRRRADDRARRVDPGADHRAC